MNKKTWVVGGSIGAVVLLLLMSFNSVVASNVHQLTMTEKSILVCDYVHKLSSTNPKFDIFKILDLLGIIFDILISWFLWFYVDIWLNMGT